MAKETKIFFASTVISTKTTSNDDVVCVADNVIEAAIKFSEYCDNFYMREGRRCVDDVFGVKQNQIYTKDYPYYVDVDGDVISITFKKSKAKEDIGWHEVYG